MPQRNRAKNTQAVRVVKAKVRSADAKRATVKRATARVRTEVSALRAIR